MSVTEFTAEESQVIEENKFFLRMICLPLGLIGLHFLAHPWPNDHLGVMVFWTLVTSYALFCWTSCFHETAHQTLSGSKTFSIILGRALGTAMFVPYSVYRESHIRHHAYLNKPTDWELWPYSDPNTSVRFRRIFVWFDIVLGVFMSPAIYGRLYFHKDSPLKKNPALCRTIRNEYIGIVLFWGTVLGLVAYYGVWQKFLVVWCIPHWLAGIYQTFRKLTEHLGMQSYDPMLGTRTVVASNWFTKMSSFMNFEIFIHGPHHRHPRVSHHVLEQKMSEYLSSNPGTKYPLYGSYLRATWDMLPYLFRNPGVGMNVGAPPPAKAKNDDVQNFVADVSAEVLAEKDVIVGCTTANVATATIPGIVSQPTENKPLMSI